jgi:hypothetical protein
MRIAHLLALFFVATLGGCGTTPFQDGTGDLAKGLDSTENSLAALDARDKTARAILAYQSAKTLDVHACIARKRVDKENCALLIDGKVVQPASEVSRGLALAKALAQYGRGLNDLATAKDVSDLNSTVGNINTAAKDAAKSVAKTTSVSLPGYIAPAGDLIAFLFGQISEFHRVQVIRSILITYGPTFDSAIGILQSETLILQTRVVDKEKVILDNEVRRFRHLTDAEERRELVRDILARQMELQPLANQDSRKPFAALREAHQKLVDIARNPQISFDDAKATISDFYKKAKALYDALHPSGGKKTS